MKTITSILLAILLWGCDSNRSDINTSTPKRDVTQPGSQYPAIVDSLNIRDLYDSAKWSTYCINCDDTCIFYPALKDSNKILTFGETELKCDSVIVYTSDTIGFSFDFYHDTLKCFHKDHDRFASFGVVYKLSTKKAQSIMVYGGLTYMEIFKIPSEAKNRYFYPEQSDVIAYLNKNKTKLNEWFYKEAIRRGLVK